MQATKRLTTVPSSSQPSCDQAECLACSCRQNFLAYKEALKGLDHIIGYAVKANNNFKIMQASTSVQFSVKLQREGVVGGGSAATAGPARALACLQHPLDHPATPATRRAAVPAKPGLGRGAGERQRAAHGAQGRL